MVRWIVGEVQEIIAQSETLSDGGSIPRAAVTVDDASSALVRFANGAQGTFEMARTRARHRAISRSR